MAGDPLARSREQVSRIGKVLLLSADRDRRAEAARALGESGAPEAYAWLRQALWDREPAVRVSVVRAIGVLGAPQALGELGALYAWSGPGMRREILRAVLHLSSTAGPGSFLGLALCDPDRGVRALARRARRRSAVPLVAR